MGHERSALVSKGLSKFVTVAFSDHVIEVFCCFGFCLGRMGNLSHAKLVSCKEFHESSTSVCKSPVKVTLKSASQNSLL